MSLDCCFNVMIVLLLPLTDLIRCDGLAVVYCRSSVYETRRSIQDRHQDGNGLHFDVGNTDI